MVLKQCLCHCRFTMKHIFVSSEEGDGVPETVAEEVALEKIKKNPEEYLEDCDCGCEEAEIL